MSNLVWFQATQFELLLFNRVSEREGKVTFLLCWSKVKLLHTQKSNCQVHMFCNAVSFRQPEPFFSKLHTHGWGYSTATLVYPAWVFQKVRCETGTRVLSLLCSEFGDLFQFTELNNRGAFLPILAPSSSSFSSSSSIFSMFTSCFSYFSILVALVMSIGSC